MRVGRLLGSHFLDSTEWPKPRKTVFVLLGGLTWLYVVREISRRPHTNLLRWRSKNEIYDHPYDGVYAPHCHHRTSEFPGSYIGTMRDTTA